MTEQNDNTRTHIVLSNGTMVAQYRITEKIGAGGMGEVYLSEDTKLNRKVALKFLSYQHSQNDEQKLRFVREAQAAAKLSHANIVHIYEVGEFQGRPFIAMEHIEGSSLRDYMKNKKLDNDEIIKLSIQICDGLQEAHSAGIVHRDIKPSNMVVDNKGRLCILDFGLATIIGADQITKTGSTLGTVGYMSPEQIRGKTVDARSDLFSLGVILYELIANRRPFTGESEAEILNSIQSIPPEPLSRYKSGVPDGVQRIVSKLLEKDTGLRYQSASGVVSDLNKELQQSSSTSFVASSYLEANSKQTSSKTRIILSGIALVVILVLLLVLKPWKSLTSPGEEALVDENRLAIMYFDNLADSEDPKRFGEIITNLLITDLTETRNLDVISNQRLYDILKQLGHEGAKKFDKDLATQVAKIARARWMLLGSVLQSEPKFIITAQLVETSTGNMVASQRIEGFNHESIFDVVDKLTHELKSDLALPESAKQSFDLNLADVTTSSPEAYRLYLEGIEAHLQYRFGIAVEKLRQATTIDSTFAEAYFEWSKFSTNQEAERLATLALRYIDHASPRIQEKIRAMYAFKVEKDPVKTIKILNSALEQYPTDPGPLSGIFYAYKLKGDIDSGITALEKLVKFDPMNKVAYNLLAYEYQRKGDYDRSIWAINKYIELAPDEPNPYDTRGDLYGFQGKLKEAKDSYAKALQIDSNYTISRRKLGTSYLHLGQYDSALVQFQWMAKHQLPSVRSQGRFCLAVIPAIQGKFKRALQVAQQGIDADKLEGIDYEENKHFLRYDIFYALGELDSAFAIMSEMNDTSYSNADSYKWSFTEMARLFAVKGMYDEAYGMEMRLVKRLPDEKEAYWYLLAYVAETREQYDSAIVYYRKCFDLVEDIWIHFYLARVYIANGQPGEAVELLEKVTRVYGQDREFATVINVTMYYYLARAYEMSGWNDKAVKEYEKFLDIWKNADSGLKEVEDAKQRLAKLKA